MRVTFLSSPRGLAALVWLIGDPRLALHTAEVFHTWEELAQTTPLERAQRLGGWAASLRVPPVAPTLETGPAEEILTPFDAEYPAGLTDLPEHPLVLARSGPVSHGLHVAVPLATPSSPDVLNALPVIVDMLAQFDATLVVPVVSSAARDLLLLARQATVPTVAVLPSAPHLPGRLTGLGEVTELGAAVPVLYWELGLLDRHGDELADRCEYLTAALSQAVLLLELAPGRRGGSATLRAAGALGRPLYVPSTEYGDRLSRLLTSSLRRRGPVARTVFGLSVDLEIHPLDLPHPV
jgi:hypothetical protein